MDSGIECHYNIDILRLGWWLGQQLSMRKKTVLFEHAVFVPDANIFPELFQREADCELTAKSIAIGSNVTKNGKSLMFSQDPADLVERPPVITFLGHVDPTSTSVYLTITEELLNQAAQRFQALAPKGGVQ